MEKGPSDICAGSGMEVHLYQHLTHATRLVLVHEQHMLEDMLGIHEGLGMVLSHVFVATHTRFMLPSFTCLHDFKR